MLLFTKDYRSLRIVENKGSTEHMAILNPSYQIPNMNLISKVMIPSMNEDCEEKFS
jgi:hypothetical protein